MNLAEFVDKLLELVEENLPDDSLGEEVIVVLPQVAEDGDEELSWDADISGIELVVVEGKKCLRIY